MKTRPKGSVLVVDDYESWRDLLRVILVSEGYEVTTASTFEEARALLAVGNFDIAILDMRLVDASIYNVQGMGLLREAKQQRPSMKAIILTGYPDPVQRDKAINFYKADGYFEKVPAGQPFDVDKFTQVISDLLQR